MSKRSLLLWAPRARFGKTLLELSRTPEDQSHTLFTGEGVPRHSVIRYAAIEHAKMVEPGTCDEVPGVCFETASLIVSIAFVPYSEKGNYPLEQRMASMPACREFYAQLVREMGRDGG